MDTNNLFDFISNDIIHSILIHSCKIKFVIVTLIRLAMLLHLYAWSTGSNYSIYFHLRYKFESSK